MGEDSINLVIWPRIYWRTKKVRYHGHAVAAVAAVAHVAEEALADQVDSGLPVVLDGSEPRPGADLAGRSAHR